MIINEEAKAQAIYAVMLSEMAHREELENQRVEISRYNNGREQGLFMIDSKSRRAVSFSEYRTTDDIVVYCGNEDDFDECGVPTQVVSRLNKKFFKKNEYAQAAWFIIGFLFDKEGSKS